MSYVIVYDKVFIKTPNGLSVAVLHGDNNVWEAGNKRRVRDWNCWLLDATESEVRTYFNEWLGREYQQHFKMNSKWIDDAALTRWVESGIKNARTLEEIRAIRPFETLHCRLSVYDGSSQHFELNKYNRNTEEFEAWIKSAKDRLKNKRPEETIYVVTAFSSNEPLRLGKNITFIKGKVIAKYKRKMFISTCNDGHWTNASANPNDAIVFDSLESAKEALGKDLANITFISAENLAKTLSAQEKTCAIKIIKDKAEIGYVTKVSSAGFYRCSYKSYAKKYTKASAKRQTARLTERFGNNYIFQIENVKEETV